MIPNLSTLASPILHLLHDKLAEMIVLSPVQIIRIEVLTVVFHVVGESPLQLGDFC